MNIGTAEQGTIGLIVESDGVIKQIGLTEHQSKLLQIYVNVLSDQPLPLLPSNYDLKPIREIK